MERDGLLRCLRVNNDGDLVPAIPPVSLLRVRALKHVGINLRLAASGCRLEHSSRSNLSTALRNSALKPFWKTACYHNLETHYTRLSDNKERLEKVTLDGLYETPKVVSQNFRNGGPS